MWRWVRKIGEWILFFLLMVFWPVVPFTQYRVSKKEKDSDPRRFALYTLAGCFSLAAMAVFWRSPAFFLFLVIYFVCEMSFWRYFRHWEKKVAS
jgi:hypothetical protein